MCYVLYILIYFEYVNVNITCSKTPKSPRSTPWDDFIVEALVQISYLTKYQFTAVEPSIKATYN